MDSESFECGKVNRDREVGDILHIYLKSAMRGVFTLPGCGAEFNQSCRSWLNEGKNSYETAVVGREF